MSVRNSIAAIELQTFNTANLLATYQPINPTGLEQACFYFSIINNSSQDITVSYDGLMDHEYIPGPGELRISVQTNAQPNNYAALLKKGTVVYVKGTAGAGTVALSGYFQQPT